MDGRISNFAEVASVRRYTYTDGSENGFRVIDCDNGRIRFLINLDRAGDIMQLYYRGENVSFISRNGFVNSERPFLSRFEGGMIYTCGLDNVGGRDGYELHGRLHLSPCRVISTECTNKGIEIKLEVKQTALFGSAFTLIRTYRTDIGSSTVTLVDELKNDGYTPDEYCLLYHVNVGYPMLDEGARVEAEVRRCTPRTENAAYAEGGMWEMTAPVPKMDEACFYLELDKPEISLVNKACSRRFTLSYSLDTLPCFLLWKSMASGDYALGLEPATTTLDSDFAKRSIAPGESVRFTLSLSVFDE